MKRVHRVILPILLLALAASPLLWSGTTGKIAGTITDKASRDPLPGAAVVVVGTSLGGVADANGHYTILEVPPGTYKLQISLVGYGKITVDEVRVYIDQTARINVALEEQPIEVATQIIVAERKTIRPDVATSVSSVTGRQVEQLPINNVVSAIGLQAGVRGGWGGALTNVAHPTYVTNYNRGTVSVQGDLNIRGGGGDAILFMVDGVTMRDPRNSEPLTRVPLASVQEVSVERGGFNAEYGQVRSGIVNVVTKEGAKRGYTGSLQYRYSPPAPKYSSVAGAPDLLDPNSFALRPFFDPAVCWTGTSNGAWDQYTKAQYPQFDGWNAVSRQLCTDNNPNNDLTPLGAQRAFEYETRKAQPNKSPDYDVDAGLGGPVPYIGDMLGDLRFFGSYRTSRNMLLIPLSRPDYRDQDVNLQVTSDITPTMKLSVHGMAGRQFTMRNNFDGTGTYFYPQSASDIASVSSNIVATSDLIGLFGDYNLSLADIDYRAYSAKLTHTVSPTTFYEVSVENLSRSYDVRPAPPRDTSALFQVLPGFYEDSNPFGYVPGIDPTGTTINGGQHVAKARDFSKVSSTTIKANFSSQVNFQNLLKGGLEFNYNDLNFDYGTISSGGQATETYQDRVKMRVFPIQGAMFLQDKAEFNEFTLSVGLRLDYANANSKWWVLDPFYTPFFSFHYSPGTAYPEAKSPPQWRFSPRLGISHPITENTKLFFNYGHFMQVPQYESLFRVDRDQTHAVVSFGNPNLILAKTISYELGFDWLPFEDYLISVAGFYNDISDQQDFTSYRSLSSGFSYTQSTSNNYQDIRGFEVTVRKTGRGWISGFANFTYQVSTTGHFNSARVFDDPTEQKNWNDATVNQYQDRPLPQPFARANISAIVPNDFGPTVAGQKIIAGLGLNVVVDWQAGGWTTWNPGNLAYVSYNAKAVDYFNVYLRFDKTVEFGKFRTQLFMDINNVFNTLRLWNTGDFSYLSSLHLPYSKDYPNIPGSDKVGQYRTPGVDYQPMKNGVDLNTPPSPANPDRAWFYNSNTNKYYVGVGDTWQEVPAAQVNKAMKDKAYIDMPNASTYWFLDPRKIFFGVKFSFNFSE